MKSVAVATRGAKAALVAKAIQFIICLIIDRGIDNMSFYKSKIIDYGYKEKIIVYENEIITGNQIDNEITRQKYQDMDEDKQHLSDLRRIRYYKKAVKELIEIAMMNNDLDVVITLTFREEITSYDMALTEWQLFLKRLRHLYDIPLKYICVWEYQKLRSEKCGIKTGGIFHFHCLMNIGYIEQKKLENIWKNGFVWINKLSSDNNRLNAILYTTKYCIKEIMHRIKNNEDVRGQRFFFTSNNLKKPQITTLEKSINLNDIIFAQMENMICDGEYYIINENGDTTNKINYIEYKK